MQKFMKAIAAIMLVTAVVITAGCTKDPNGESEPTTEGIYLGVIGFNNKLYPKNIGLLDNSTLQSYYSFIDDLSMADNTKLYYADYTALQQLKSYGEPPKLTNVALVTFTDGLDNASLASSSNPENYANTEDYIASINRKIKSDKVHGLIVSAYSIGLKGNDVVDVERFRNDLKLLASNENNVFEVASMNEALERFSEIASSLHSVTTTASLSVLVPPGYDDGRIIRFTFDNISVNQVNNSTRYIECTYKRPGTGIRLDNITYYGFEEGASSLYSNEMDENESYRFVFENLVKSNGENISDADTTYLKLYKKISTSPGWEPETEFKPSASSHVDEERSSALIMLVLDCTTSLGSEFSALKKGAKRFVETLVNSNGSGNNNGGGNSGSGGNGGNGGGGTNTNTIPTVTTSEVTEISSHRAVSGGTVTSNGGSAVNQVGVCWSTNHNPTTSDSYSIETEWTGGSFYRSMQGLASNTTYYVRAYATNSIGTGYDQERSFVTEDEFGGNIGGSGSYNGYEYVDMGLPSGTLWATCNVGATTPEGYGNYYAWGETTTKSIYNWSTYKYCNGGVQQLTKYCDQSFYGYNGFSDNLTVLQPMDDAATANWGNGWRIPTKEEWQELKENTTHKWITINGVKGLLFTASNGNNLFIPASGWFVDGGQESIGHYGYCWSNAILSQPYFANRFVLEENSCNYHGGCYRSTGLPVRPVCSAK